MKKPNPFEANWKKYDELLEKDKNQHTDDIYYKSGYEPLYKIQGVFSNGRLNINLSDMYNFLIQEVGRFCEHYASDFLITYDSLTRLIENTCPDNPTTYRFIGIRESGVDDVAYVISRMTKDHPEYLASYYRKLYAIRIRHEGLDHSPKHATYVHVELRDFTGNIYNMTANIQKSGFSVDDYYQQNNIEKSLDILQDLHTIQNLIRKIGDYREGVLENIRRLNDAAKPDSVTEIYISKMREDIQNMENRIYTEMQEVSTYMQRISPPTERK